MFCLPQTTGDVLNGNDVEKAVAGARCPPLKKGSFTRSVLKVLFCV